MKKKWYESKTVWSGVVWTVAGVLASLGYEAEVMKLVQLLATAGIVYGFRDAF